MQFQNALFQDQQIITHMKSSKNRNCFVFPNSPIVIDSCFPSGNLGQATMISQNTFQIRGNSDIQNDPFSKYWFYFRVRKVPLNMKLKFILKDLNSLRKLANKEKDRRMRPYIVFNDGIKWQPLYPQFQTTIDKIQKINAQFSIKFKAKTQVKQLQGKKKDKNKKLQSNQYYFALNYPYTIQNLQKSLIFFQNKIQKQDYIYYNNEILCSSVQGRSIKLITLTSMSNIQNFYEKQLAFHHKLFPNKNSRPFKFKQQIPVIVITGRVHPSEIASSYFIESLIKFLSLQDNEVSKLLRQMFIFYIIPMLNPDGVQNGNFRFDNQSKNLNRFYGFSDFQSTPAIRAVQQIFIFLNGHSKGNQKRRRVAMYFDVHGHNSPKPSFIFGNHTQNFIHATQNRLFCKLLESIALKGSFSYLNCEFSQNNMNVKEKYDHHSKQGSGRVFVGKKVGQVIEQKQRQDFNSQNDQQQQQQNKDKMQNSNKQNVNIQHSYTLEVCPYFSAISYRKQKQDNQKIITSQNQNYPSYKMEFPQYCQNLAKSFCQVILEILNINPKSSNNFSKYQNSSFLRENIYSQLCRAEKIRNKTITSMPRINERSSQRQKVFDVQTSSSQLNTPFSKQQNKNQQNNYYKPQINIYNAIQQQYFDKWFSNNEYLNGLQKKNFKWKNQKLKKFIQKAKNYLNKKQGLKQNKIIKQTSFRVQRSYTEQYHFDQKDQRQINQSRKLNKQKKSSRLNTFMASVSKAQIQNQQQFSSSSQSDQQTILNEDDQFDKKTIKQAMRQQFKKYRKKNNGNIKNINIVPNYEDDHKEGDYNNQNKVKQLNNNIKSKTQKTKSYKQKFQKIKSNNNQNKQYKIYNLNQFVISNLKNDHSPLKQRLKKSYTQVKQHKQQKQPYLQKLFKKQRNQNYRKRSSIKKSEKDKQQQALSFYQDPHQNLFLKEIIEKMKNIQKVKGQNFVTANVVNNSMLWKNTTFMYAKSQLVNVNPVLKVKLHSRLYSNDQDQIISSNHKDKKQEIHLNHLSKNKKDQLKFSQKYTHKEKIKQQKKAKNVHFSNQRLKQLKRMNRLLQLRNKN